MNFARHLVFALNHIGRMTFSLRRIVLRILASSLLVLTSAGVVVMAAPPASSGWSSSECVVVNGKCVPGTYGSYPKSVKPENFHPGYYIMAGKNDGQYTFDKIKGNPDFVGVMKVYVWRDMETSEGVYDFSNIENDLAYLRSIGKRLIIYFEKTEWYTPGPPRTPSYMWNNPIYGGNASYWPSGVTFYGAYQNPPGQGAWRATIWNSNVQNRMLAIISALGKRFNGEPYIEGLNLGETSAEPGPDYSPSALESAFKAIALGAKNAFPGKTVILQPNFAPFDIVQFGKWLADNGIGIGTPDLVVNETVSEPYLIQKTHHDAVPTAPDVEWDNYERCKAPPHWAGCTAPGTYFTSAEILDWTVKNINPWYMIWDATRGEFTRDTISAVRNYGPLPAARDFYNSLKQ